MNSTKPVTSPTYLLRRIRSLSWLSWEELSIPMRVSKRTLHLWSSGQPIRQDHLRHLHLVANLIDRLDKGNPVHLRGLLLKDLGGKNALTLLGEGQFTLVENQLAPGMPNPSFGEVPAEVFRKRMPRGVSLESYQENQEVRTVQEKVLNGVRPPKLRKG